MKKKHSDLRSRIALLPLATLALIAINVVAFLCTRESAGAFSDARYSPIQIYGVKPADVKIGKLLTSAFVHDGIAHLTVNMVLLFAFGRAVERAMGRLEFLIFYLCACFASSLAHVGMTLVAVSPAYYADMPIIGASGAVAGLMGIYAIRFHRRTFRVGDAELPVLLVILAWLALQVILAVLGLYDLESVLGVNFGMVSYWSHLGGFGFGILVALIADMALAGEREHLVELAARNSSEGNLLEAASNYEAILRYDPEDASAHAELGRLWAILDEREQSLPSYGEAIRLYVADGNEEEALAAAEQMRLFWPNAAVDSATHYRFALYLEETGQIERALGSFRQLCDSEEETPEKQMSLLKTGHLLLAHLNDPTAAVRVLREFLDRYPDGDWRAFAEETLARAESEMP